MILQEQFPRAAVFWILIAQCVVFVPHFSNMPLWLTTIYFGCLAWRFGVYQGRWDYPNFWMKLLLMLAAFAGVLLSFQTISGGRGGVALLLLAFAYKALEMKQQRDAYLVIMLAYFVVACAFLYQRSFFAAGYLLACLAIISAALVSMNHLPKKAFDLSGLWLSIKMLLQALPLMVFLFIFFPQLPPLFQINLGSNEAKTGLSDTMNPGSISDLTRSDELAFRVQFKGERPPQSELYWRAQVFERFDGIGWKMSSQKPAALHYHDVIASQNHYSYEIFQEASDQQLLFSLATAWSDDASIVLNQDFTLSRNKKVDRLFHYRVESNPHFKRDLVLSDLSRQLNTSLPAYGNEQAKTFAQKLSRNSTSESAFIETVLLNYREQHFEYTLKPPMTGANPVDDFLFKTRKGFCEHFASSFVYLMRAGGVPARIVGGYLGGEYNARGDYLLVHQFDAHAWAEVWLEGEGWVRVDPTAFVAPERVNRGIEQALPAGESILEGNLLAARKFDVLTGIRLQLDYLNMQWDKWVLGYDEEKQQQIWQNILGEVTPQRIAVFMLLCFSLVILSTLTVMYLKDFLRVKDPADRLYMAMERKLKRKRIYRLPSETPNQFAERLEQHNLASGSALQQFTQGYVRLKYQNNHALAHNQKQILAQMKASIKAMG